MFHSTSPPHGRVTIDVGAAQARQMIVGSVVAGGLGVISVAAAITGDVEGGTGTRVAALVLGLVFSLVGALPLLLRRIAFRPRRLVLDSAGLRWEDPQGAPWTVGWAELAEVTLSYPAPPAKTGKLASAVALTLRPADSSFREAHPEMKHLIVSGGGDSSLRYRIPFGHTLSVVGPADRALGHYAPRIYHRDGPAVPPPRDRPWTVNLAVALMACFWAFIVAVPVVAEGAASAPLGALGLWTAVVAVWLGRVRAGGASAVTAATTLSRLFGALGLVGMIMCGFVVLTSPYRDPTSWKPLLGLPAGLVTTVGLLVSGWLLSGKDVREWMASRTWGL